MTVIVHFNTAFENMTRDDIKSWITLNRHKLVGSAIFTKSNSIVSKVVRWAEQWQEPDWGFVPSHVGAVVKKDGELYVVDVIPPKVRLVRLIDYLMRTDIEFALVLRNFPLNGKMFSINLLDKVGEWYPYMSAIRSVFTKRRTKYRQHCSEAVLRQYQLQGRFKNINVECTPLELYNIMIDS